jgi:RNA polymerase sigma-70 factor (ECF subfamily)
MSAIVTNRMGGYLPRRQNGIEGLIPSPSRRQMTDRLDEERLRELMVAYQSGAYEAFEALYASLIGPVRGWLIRITRDAARAEDLAQDAFLQVHRARHTYDPAYPVLPWVMAIARHVYLMDRRTASRRPRYVGGEHAPERAVGPEADRHMQGAPVREALRRLSPDRRDAVLLHHVGGWSFRDIARRFGISDAAAKLRSSRAMRQLREALRGGGEHD